MSRLDPLVWAKDDSGHRHLCPMSSLSDPHAVKAEEMESCISDDSSLESWKTVPSNDPEGRIRFAPSASPN